MLHDAFDYGGRRPFRSWQPKHPERLFFGILLDRYAALRADRLRQVFCDKHHVEGTLRGRERLHISLHHLGDHARLPARTIFAAKRAAENIPVPSFEVTLNSIGSFAIAGSDGRRAKHALVLRAEGAGLVELRWALGTALRRMGLRAGEHFTPHVTLLYGPDAVAKQPIEPIRFSVRQFALIHSELGLSKYNVIGLWPLNRA